MSVAKYDYVTMPNKLPDKPEAYLIQMALHLNFSGDKGAGAYTVRERAGGREMPFTFHYNTRDGIRGFALPGVKPLLTWDELRETWPLWIKRARAKQLSKTHG